MIANFVKKSLIVAGALLAFSSLAQAQILLPQDRGYVGLLLGHSKTSDLDGRFGFGAEGGLRFTNGWGGLLYFESSDGKTNGFNTQILHYGVGVNYELSQVLGGLTLGAKLGAGAYDSSRGNVTSANDSTGFSYGPVIAYDYMASEVLSIGGQVQHLWTNWDDTEGTTAVYLTGKFWL